MQTLPISKVKDRLNELVDATSITREQVTITKNGSPAAVLIGVDEWESIQRPCTGCHSRASANPWPRPTPTRSPDGSSTRHRSAASSVCPSAIGESPAASYEVIFTATARRDLQRVPPRIVPAIVEFVFGDLAAAPQLVGKPLERELSGSFSARRGPYRVLYRIDEDAKLVTLLRIAHRLAHAGS